MAITGLNGKKYPFLDNYWIYRHGDSLSGHRHFVDDCPYTLPDSELELIAKRKAERIKLQKLGLYRRNKFW